MLRTRQAFPSSIIKRRPLVGVADSIGAEVLLGVEVPMLPGAIKEVDELLSILQGVVNVVEGEDGGIGKRTIELVNLQWPSHLNGRCWRKSNSIVLLN
jgi:hypothetical protein